MPENDGQSSSPHLTFFKKPIDRIKLMGYNAHIPYCTHLAMGTRTDATLFSWCRFVESIWTNHLCSVERSGDMTDEGPRPYLQAASGPEDVAHLHRRTKRRYSGRQSAGRRRLIFEHTLAYACVQRGVRDRGFVPETEWLKIDGKLRNLRVLYIPFIIYAHHDIYNLANVFMVLVYGTHFMSVGLPHPLFSFGFLEQLKARECTWDESQLTPCPSKWQSPNWSQVLKVHGNNMRVKLASRSRSPNNTPSYD